MPSKKKRRSEIVSMPVLNVPASLPSVLNKAIGRQSKVDLVKHKCVVLMDANNAARGQRARVPTTQQRLEDNQSRATDL